jgi:hypothetical protein
MPYSHIMGNHAPAGPSGEAGLAVIASALQAELAFEHTDAAFDAGMIAATTSEPGLGFELTPALRFVAGLGKMTRLTPCCVA